MAVGVVTVPVNRADMLALVVDGVAAGLPVPTSIALNIYESSGSTVRLRMADVAQIEPWRARLGLRWEPVAVYRGSGGGWQWSVSAERREWVDNESHLVDVTYLEAMDVQGPVRLPDWLIETAGVCEPRSEVP